jgi:hypothetical protein
MVFLIRFYDHIIQYGAILIKAGENGTIPHENGNIIHESALILTIHKIP